MGVTIMMCSLVPGLVLLCLASLTSASPKKGLCIPPGENFHCGDLETFNSVSWWYNWHTRPNHVVDGYCSCDTAPDCGPEPDKPSFIPMIWGYHTDDWWHDDIDDPVADKYHTILRLLLLLGLRFRSCTQTRYWSVLLLQGGTLTG